jgi:hypothetical protein
MQLKTTRVALPQEKYQGFTYKELNDKFSYDKVEGKFYNKRTGKILDSTKGGKMYLGIRIADETISLQPARVALILVDQYFPKDDERVVFKDNDSLNFAYTNLKIIKKRDAALFGKNAIRPKAHKTPVDGVVKIMPMGYFVARRGPEQSVYRSYDFEEVVSIRKEWELDNTIHRWDKTMPRCYTT